MALTNAGGAHMPTKLISPCVGNTPLSKGEATRRKNKKERKKNTDPIPDSPRYAAQVRRENEARALAQENERNATAKKGNESAKAGLQELLALLVAKTHC